jgi:hypothetical protein
VIVWLLILGSLPAVVTLLRARRVDHIALFSAGYLYYWVFPVLVGQFTFAGAETNAAYQTWLSIFESVSPRQFVVYSISILVYYACFRLGDALAQRKKFKPSLATAPALNFVPLLYGCVFIVAVGFTFQIRSAIGMDYSELGDAFTAKGTLTAISLVLLALALLITTTNEETTFIATVSNRWILGYFLIAVLLLGMGERLYVMTSLLLLVAYRSVFFKKYTLPQLLAFVFGMAALSAVAGLIRLRASVDISSLILNLAFEPVFTAYSLISFLGSNHVPWIAFPKFLAGDFLNLVPTAVMGNKQDFLPDPTKAGYYFVSPLGALNSWVSFIINFGLIGTAFVMSFVGYLLGWLRKEATSPIVKTQYLMCSAFMVFTFFRDPFSVSLVKNIFEFSLFAPLFLALVSGLLTWSSVGIRNDVHSRIHLNPHL